MAPKTFGPYALTQTLGKGGMGTVYRALPGPHAPKGLPDVVALKILHDDLSEALASRFLREARLGQRLDAPNVMKIFDAIEIRESGHVRRALVMELVPGSSLRDVLLQDGPLSEALVRHVIIEVAAGLSALHAHGIIHRDIKPENVILLPDGGAKLVDLGIARHEIESTRISQTGQFVGSLLHAAPEQFSGANATDTRADLFSLGGLFFELMTGQHPFFADSVGSILKQILHARAPRLDALRPDVDPLLVALVDQLLEKDPAKRPQHADEVRAALLEGRRGAWWRDTGRARVEERGTGYRPQVRRGTAFVGRVEQIAQLDHVLSNVVTGQAELVLMEGNGGMGKSRLVDAWLGSLPARELPDAIPKVVGGGWSHVSGRGGLAGLRAAFGSIPASASDPRLQAFLSGAVAGAAPLPVLEEALAETLKRHAANRPLVLVLEDLDDAGPDGARLVAALLDLLAAHRVLMIATSRPGALGPWASELAMRRPVTRVSLDALEAHEVTALLSEALSNAVLAHDLTKPMMARAGGSPFHLLQMVYAMEREGAIRRDQDDRLTRVDRSMGELLAQVDDDALESVVRKRLSALGDDERELLDLGVCLGRMFHPGDVASLLGREPLGVLRALGRIARDGGLIVGHGRTFAFETPRVARAVLALVPEPLRFAYHSAIVANRLRAFQASESGSDALQVLPHAVQVEDAEAVEATWNAAIDLLVGRGERAAAAEQLRVLLDRPGLVEGASRVAMLIRIGDPLTFGGAYVDLARRLEEAETLARALGDHAAVAESGLRQSTVALSTNDLDHANACIERATLAAEAAGDVSLRLRSEVLRAQLAQARGEVDTSQSILEQVIQMADTHQLREIQGQSHHTLGVLLRQLRQVDVARPHLDACARIARELRSDAMLLSALDALTFFPFLDGDWQLAETLQREALGLANNMGDRVARTRQNTNLGQIMMLRGDLGAAWGHVEQAVEWGRTLSTPDAHAGALRLLVRLGALCGCFSDSRSALEELADLRVEKGPIAGAGFAVLSEGVLSAAQGSPKDALGHYAKAEKIFREGKHENGLLFVLLRRATAYEHLGEFERIAALAQEARSIAIDGHAGPLILQCDAMMSLSTGHIPEDVRARRNASAAAITPHVAAYLDFCFYRTEGNADDLARARKLLEQAASTLSPDRSKKFREGVSDHRRILGMD